MDKRKYKIIQKKVISVGYKSDGFWGKILFSTKSRFSYLVINEKEAIDTWIEKKINEYNFN